MDESLNDSNMNFEPASEAFIAFDATGHISKWSEMAENLFGWTKNEAIGKQLFPLIFPEESLETYYEKINYFLATDESDFIGEKVALIVKDKQGNLIETESRINPVPRLDGSYMFHIFLNRLVESKEDEEEALSNYTAFNGSHDALVSLDKERTILAINKAAEKLYGYTSEEAIGKKIEMLVPSGTSGEKEDLYHYVENTLNSGENFQDEELSLRSKNGNVFESLININSVKKSGSDEIVGVVVAAKDISEQLQVEDKLVYMQEHDVLTDLPNRHAFAKEFQKILSEDKSSTGSLVIMDIDHFKLINDSYGHNVGDSIIQIAAGILKSQFDNSKTSANIKLATEGIVSHFGGDEFTLLLPNKDPEQARSIANGLIASIANKVWDQHQINLSISAGITPYDTAKHQNAETLIIAADTSLFEAKEGGRGKTVLYSEGQASRLAWAEKLRKALDQGNLILYQQPIQNIKTGQVERYELLLRMKIGNEIHPPTPFLASAERLGLIGEVDVFVVNKGIELAATGKVVEINLSAKALTSPKLIAEIDSKLKSTNCDPNNVIFEITETSAVANFIEATELIKSLTQLGCSFCLDDFGTGFGSFAYLKNLPVSGIKIDGEFVKNITSNEVDQRIVAAIVMIASALEKETVAEWVGDEETLEMLKHLGVDYAQGYLIGKPEPIPSQVSS